MGEGGRGKGEGGTPGQRMICKRLHGSWDLSGGLGQENTSENLTSLYLQPRLFSPAS